MVSDLWEGACIEWTFAWRFELCMLLNHDLADFCFIQREDQEFMTWES